MNIQCQNSAYVGRTHLSSGGNIFDSSILQGEIDTLTSNLDILQTNYDITSNDIYEYLNPLTYLINTELTPPVISIPPVPAIINTYVYNSNVLGEIRFWVKDTQSFPVVIPIGVPDYRVKIDIDGKLKLYYTYDPIINLTWGNGWIDPANMIIGAAADSFNQGTTIGVIQGELVVMQQTIDAELEAIAHIIDQTFAINGRLIRPAQASDVSGLLDVIRGANTLDSSMASVNSAYEAITGFFATGNTGFVNNALTSINGFIANNPATSFMLGAGGVGVSIAYGILQGEKYNEFIYSTLLDAINQNSNLTSNQRRTVSDHAEYDLISSNLIKNLQKNYYLNQTQGFINSNILTTQTVPQIFTNKIGIGISPSTFPLDVVGNINADYYYRAGVKQFVGTSNDYSNLSRSQGFLNSNILSSQTIQQLYGSKIGLGISPEISVFPLDVVGSINGDYYYRGGVRQFMGTQTEYLNLTQSQGFINSNILSTQNIPQINANIYYRSNVPQFMGTQTEYSNLTRLQGFINSNVLSTQTIPKITTTEILLNSTNINTVIDDKITTASNALVNYNNHTNKPWINSGTTIYSANTGNIGIGTATPAYKLDVNGTFNASQVNIGGVDILTTITNASNYLINYNNHTNKPWINSGTTIYSANTGNTGIGTATPAYKLDVNGTFNASQVLIAGTDILTTITNASNYLINYNNHTNKPWINSGTNIYSANTGNTGIGTATPSYKLDVIGISKGDSVYAKQLYINPNLVVGNSPDTAYCIDAVGEINSSSLRINGDGTERTLRIYGLQSSLKATIGVAKVNQQFSYSATVDDLVLLATSNIHFQNGTGTANAAMSIKNNLVGIGTASPSEKLEIIGNTKIASNLIVSGSVGIGTASPSVKLDIWGGALKANGLTINGAENLNTILNTNSIGLTCGTGYNIYFNVGSGGEVMRVHNNNCVGIGVNSPVFKLDVGGKINANGLRLDGYSTTNTIEQAAGALGFNVAANNGINFSINNVERFKISDAGNIFASGLNLFQVELRDCALGWQNYQVIPTSLFGDGCVDPSLYGGTKYLTMTRCMFREMHIVSPTPAGDITIRFGRCGGISTGSYWDVGCYSTSAFVIRKDGNTPSITVEPNTNIVFNAPSVYFNANIVLNGSSYMTGGTNVKKHIWYTGAPITPYSASGYYKIDIYPQNVLALGNANLRWFNISWCATAFTVNSYNFPIGSSDVMIDYGINGGENHKNIYLGNNTYIDFGYLTSGYFTIMYNGSIGSSPINVYITPKNTY